MPVAGAPDAIEGEPIGIPVMCAVDLPLISAWTDALNVPLMPAKLFKNVSTNRYERACGRT